MPNTRGFQELKEAVKLAFDALLRNPMRSFLTVLGIVIGVSTVIAIGAVVNGLNSNVVGQIESLGSNVIICYKFSFVTLGRRPAEELQRKELKSEWADGIARLPHIVAAAPSARIQNNEFGTGTSFVRRGDLRIKNVILQGNTASIAEINNLDLASGRFFNETDQQHRSPVVVLGSDTAAALFPAHEDALGKEVLVEGQGFTVIGVLAHQGQAFGNGKNPNDNIAIFPLSTFLRIHPEYKDYALFAKVDDAKNMPEAVDEIRDYLRRMRRLPSDKPDNFAVFTTDSFIDLWKQISDGIFAVMFAVGSVALLVGGIGVMNIMLVSVTERTREIGVRKAIGARRGNILMQFLFEAVALALIGGVLGELLGAALGLSVRVLFPALPASISLFWVILGFSVSTLIGIFFGVYPAWKAASLNPVDALRYE
ncbi:MAG TPA: ABC transporter permease [Candidatus Acidoferrales bacterium]|jgi:putative ABC transport system permease protein|nr:ABC transporter permease [Candidatus Acidoferrales bacterium]